MIVPVQEIVPPYNAVPLLILGLWPPVLSYKAVGTPDMSSWNCGFRSTDSFFSYFSFPVPQPLRLRHRLLSVAFTIWQQFDREHSMFRSHICASCAVYWAQSKTKAQGKLRRPAARPVCFEGEQQKRQTKNPSRPSRRWMRLHTAFSGRGACGRAVHDYETNKLEICQKFFVIWSPKGGKTGV